MYIHIHTHTDMLYTCMYVCMHACMHACMYVCTYVCTHVRTVRTRTYVRYATRSCGRRLRACPGRPTNENANNNNILEYYNN